MENTASGTVVGEVRATDSDSGTFGQIEYILYGSSDVIDRYFKYSIICSSVVIV